MPFWIALLAVVLMLQGCAALRPVPKTTAERLDVFPRNGLPVERPVTIRWNRFQVPFVEAETDRDLAFAMGMVHGHLRLAEIRVLKQLVQGRASEMVGPVARNIDHALRIMDIGRAAPEMVRQLPESERMLLESFAAGLNLYQSRLTELPPEFSLLGLAPEPFTVEELVSIGRLGGVDINWLVYMGLLRLREHPDFERIWARALDAGAGPVVSFPAGGEIGALEEIILGTARSGSNAFVVAPKKSASGSALIAGDPHLGMGVPNLWLLAGMRSPSFTGVGFMIPGLPFIAEGPQLRSRLGRDEHPIGEQRLLRFNRRERRRHRDPHDRDQAALLGRYDARNPHLALWADRVGCLDRSLAPGRDDRGSMDRPSGDRRYRQPVRGDAIAQCRRVPRGAERLCRAAAEFPLCGHAREYLPCARHDAAEARVDAPASAAPRCSPIRRTNGRSSPIPRRCLPRSIRRRDFSPRPTTGRPIRGFRSAISSRPTNACGACSRR